ncbi:hypothetical protein E1091_10645, partial [Micromonospora fluostatini]
MPPAGPAGWFTLETSPGQRGGRSTAPGQRGGRSEESDMWRGLIEAYRDRLPVTDATPVVT